MSMHKPYSYRTTVQVGKNHQTTIWPRPGLFIYSGLGVGNYYSTSMRVVECTPVDAKELADREGVTYNYQDYKDGNFEQYKDGGGYPIESTSYMCSDGSLHTFKENADDHERYLRFTDWYAENELMTSDNRPAVVDADVMYEWVRFNFDSLKRLTQEEQ